MFAIVRRLDAQDVEVWRVVRKEEQADKIEKASGGELRAVRMVGVSVSRGDKIVWPLEYWPKPEDYNLTCSRPDLVR